MLASRYKSISPDGGGCDGFKLYEVHKYSVPIFSLYQFMQRLPSLFIFENRWFGTIIPHWQKREMQSCPITLGFFFIGPSMKGWWFHILCRSGFLSSGDLRVTRHLLECLLKTTFSFLSRCSKGWRWVESVGEIKDYYFQAQKITNSAFSKWRMALLPNKWFKTAFNFNSDNQSSVHSALSSRTLKLPNRILIFQWKGMHV